MRCAWSVAYVDIEIVMGRDRGDERDPIAVEMAARQPERGKDQRELADLAQRHARQETHPAGVAEPAHDSDDDERLGDEYERRQHERGAELHTKPS